MKQKILALLLSLVLVLNLLPVNGFAEVLETGSELLATAADAMEDAVSALATSSDSGVTMGGKPLQYNVYYNNQLQEITGTPTTGYARVTQEEDGVEKLELNDFVYSAEAPWTPDSSTTRSLIYCTTALKIVVIGNNQISASGIYHCNLVSAFFSTGKNVEITGTGALVLESGENQGSTAANATDGNSTAIYMQGNARLTITDSVNLTVVGKNARQFSRGIDSQGTLLVTDDVVLNVKCGDVFGKGSTSGENSGGLVFAGKIADANENLTGYSIEINENAKIYVQSGNVLSSTHETNAKSFGMSAHWGLLVSGNAYLDIKTGTSTKETVGLNTYNGTNLKIAENATVYIQANGDKAQAMNGSIVNSTTNAQVYAGSSAENVKLVSDEEAKDVGTFRSHSYICIESGLYFIWVGGMQLSRVNRNDIGEYLQEYITNDSLADTVSGTAAYDPGTRTLTLTNFSFDGAGYTHDGITFYGNANQKVNAGILAAQDLNIVLEGENTITINKETTDATVNAGIYVQGTLTITGDGTLNTTGGDATNGHSMGIGAGEIEISGNAKVNATGGKTTVDDTKRSNGIYADGKITISGNTVVVADTAAGSRVSTGINANGSAAELTITGNAVVTAYARSSEKGDSIGIRSSNGSNGGTIVFSGNCQVEAYGAYGGAAGNNSAGVYGAGGVQIADHARVHAEGGDSNANSSAGIGTSKDMSITGGWLRACSSGSNATSDAMYANNKSFEVGDGALVYTGESPDGSDKKLMTTWTYDSTNPVHGPAYLEVDFGFPLWVGGEQVTEGNRDNILPNGTGKASYDPDTKTLTLDGFSYVGSGHTVAVNETETQKEYYASIYSALENLTIHFKGDNTISTTTPEKPAEISRTLGIYSNGGELNFTGSGTLKVTAGKNVSDDSRSWGIYADKPIKINLDEGAVLTSTGNEAKYSAGIEVSTGGNLTISSGTVIAQGGLAWNGSRGIDSYGKVTINGSANVKASFAGANSTVSSVSPNSQGILTVDDNMATDIEIDTTGYVTIESSSASGTYSTYGIHANGQLIIKNGKVTVNLPETKANSSGLYASTDITISGTETVVNATGGACSNKDSISSGLRSAGNMTISNSTVVATTVSGTGKSHAIQMDAYTATMTISGTANVTATGNDGEQSHGIFTGGNITIKDSAVVTATAQTANRWDSVAIASWYEDESGKETPKKRKITIQDSAQVIAKGGYAKNTTDNNPRQSMGIYGAKCDITISGTPYVHAQGGEATGRSSGIGTSGGNLDLSGVTEGVLIFESLDSDENGGDDQTTQKAAAIETGTNLTGIPTDMQYEHKHTSRIHQYEIGASADNATLETEARTYSQVNDEGKKHKYLRISPKDTDIGVPYVEADGTPKSVRFAYSLSDWIRDYGNNVDPIVLGGGHVNASLFPDGEVWFIVDTTITVNTSLVIDGKVNLILKNDTTLTTQGISCSDDGSLTIWVQTHGDDRGKLVATGEINNVTVNGGDITAGALNSTSISSALVHADSIATGAAVTNSVLFLGNAPTSPKYDNSILYLKSGDAYHGTLGSNEVNLNLNHTLGEKGALLIESGKSLTYDAGSITGGTIYVNHGAKKWPETGTVLLEIVNEIKDSANTDTVVEVVYTNATAYPSVSAEDTPSTIADTETRYYAAKGANVTVQAKQGALLSVTAKDQNNQEVAVTAQSGNSFIKEFTMPSVPVTLSGKSAKLEVGTVAVLPGAHYDGVTNGSESISVLCDRDFTIQYTFENGYSDVAFLWSTATTGAAQKWPVGTELVLLDLTAGHSWTPFAYRVDEAKSEISIADFKPMNGGQETVAKDAGVFVLHVDFSGVEDLFTTNYTIAAKDNSSALTVGAVTVTVGAFANEDNGTIETTVEAGKITAKATFENLDENVQNSLVVELLDASDKALDYPVGASVTVGSVVAKLHDNRAIVDGIENNTEYTVTVSGLPEGSYKLKLTLAQDTAAGYLMQELTNSYTTQALDVKAVVPTAIRAELKEGQSRILNPMGETLTFNVILKGADSFSWVLQKKEGTEYKDTATKDSEDTTTTDSENTTTTDSNVTKTEVSVYVPGNSTTAVTYRVLFKCGDAEYSLPIIVPAK